MGKSKISSDALIFRIVAFIISLTGIIMHLSAGRFMSEGFMIKHNMAYFTIQTNIFISVLFLILIIKTLVNRKNTDKIKIAVINPVIHTGLTFYITITMLGFWVLLAPTTGINSSPYIFCSSMLLHTVTPLLAIADFLIFVPHGRLVKKDVLKWLVYPAVYLVFVFIYSKTITEPYYSFNINGTKFDLMYPYPFLDAAFMGVKGVIIAVIVLIILFALLGLLYIWIDKKLGKIKTRA